MRFSTSCQSCTSCAPKKLVAKMPVRSTMTSVSTAPRPGMCTPSQLSVWNDTGMSSSDASSVSKITFNTQSVMISGIQISSPVMKYFLSRPEEKTFFTASENEKARTLPGRSDGSAAQAAALVSDLASDFESGLESVLVSDFVSDFASDFESGLASVFDSDF